jgi:hypothetical protein
LIKKGGWVLHEMASMVRWFMAFLMMKNWIIVDVDLYRHDVVIPYTSKTLASYWFWLCSLHLGPLVGFLKFVINGSAWWLSGVDWQPDYLNWAVIWCTTGWMVWQEEQLLGL